jgi:crotonobetainyl-CoA:carnitine CoA-transferase CaiB-like acyl-CoA transferase
MMLGDMGADVIKIERPGTGDETRGWGPPFDAEGRSAYFLSINRNKKSLVADLSDATDREVIAGLMKDADVVVENFRPGTLERVGLGWSETLKKRPGLVWCTITGFGDDSRRPGYDYVVQAESGWMAVTGEPSGAPMKSGIALADVMAGKDAAIAVLGALVAKERTGQGQRVSVSLLGSATAALINVAQNALVSGNDARRWGNAHANLVPYQLFDAADRPMVIAVGSDAQWKAAARALGLASLAADPRLDTNAGRLTHRAEVVEAIASRVRTAPAEQWLSALENAGVPCGVVKTVLEALRAVDVSPLTGVAPSIPGTVRLPPPTLGEHDEIIRRLGWNAFA